MLLNEKKITKTSVRVLLVSAALGQRSTLMLTGRAMAVCATYLPLSPSSFPPPPPPLFTSFFLCPGILTDSVSSAKQAGSFHRNSTQEEGQDVEECVRLWLT